MSMSKEQLLEAMIDSACGVASPECLAALTGELASPRAVEFQQKFEKMLAELREQEDQVPAELDATVRDLIRRGVPEDPWSVILEITGESIDLARLGHREDACGTSTLPRGEAAELEGTVAPVSAKAVVKGRFERVNEYAGSGRSKTILAAPLPGWVVGVVLSALSVPIQGVEVTWVTADKRAGRTVTDARGGFVIGEQGELLVEISLGSPVSIGRLAW